MGDTTDRGEPVGKRCESVPHAYKNVSSLHPKRSTGEVSSPSEVAEDLLDPR